MIIDYAVRRDKSVFCAPGQPWIEPTIFAGACRARMTRLTCLFPTRTSSRPVVVRAQSTSQSTFCLHRDSFRTYR